MLELQVTAASFRRINAVDPSIQQSDKPKSQKDHAGHQKLIQERDAGWTFFLGCYTIPKGTCMYKCHKLRIDSLLENKKVTCKVNQAMADQAQEDVLTQVKAVQGSSKAILRASQQQKQKGKNQKRRRRLESATTEELVHTCESFKKLSKILRITAPVASSSTMQNDAADPVASSIPTPLMKTTCSPMLKQQMTLTRQQKRNTKICSTCIYNIRDWHG
ncbi:hypothetical protein M413DRAFT_21137 [Hebeloma cylindrosporum]|uniref:Uncharacterized protein n=1 Tax=Hebeloma cylindrosporum TaxID=76867 RepID=A0A0C2Z6L4_HEBCY|nr:hypothetical protein M413DRAFT_21137 [Hebeloma cylindrosporum h7]